MNAREAVIVDLVRTPFGRGRPGGALSGYHPVDLYAKALNGLIERTGLDPALVEDVITGCVIQVGEQSANIGRQAVLAAGWPVTVPAVTLDRKCGSAQQAMDFAAQGIIAGAYDIVVAGGVEMMSRETMKSNRMGRDNQGPLHHQRFPEGLVPQGISAELIAAKWSLSRRELDAFSLRSHQLADAARDLTARDIIAVGDVNRDEGIRPDTSAEKLAGLKPAFEDAEMAERFPQINWSVTAGNSSQVTDGAAAMLLMERKTAERLGLAPRAAVRAFAVVGDDPYLMLTGPIPATRRLLHKTGLTIDDIDAFEINEAFASVVLAWQRELDVPLDRVNQFGGAIAMGHPVGASGMRLMANLLHALERSGGRFGLQSMCESGGMANATLIERL